MTGFKFTFESFRGSKSSCASDKRDHKEVFVGIFLNPSEFQDGAAFVSRGNATGDHLGILFLAFTSTSIC